MLAAGLSAACEEPVDPTLPTAEEIEAYYEYEGSLDGELTGNVALVTVYQSALQLRRGGTLWAKVGPYIFLFTEETFQLLEDHPGLAGATHQRRADRCPLATIAEHRRIGAPGRHESRDAVGRSGALG
jgi:hypothetical protein